MFYPHRNKYQGTDIPAIQIFLFDMGVFCCCLGFEESLFWVSVLVVLERMRLLASCCQLLLCKRKNELLPASCLDAVSSPMSCTVPCTWDTRHLCHWLRVSCLSFLAMIFSYSCWDLGWQEGHLGKNFVATGYRIAEAKFFSGMGTEVIGGNSWRKILDRLRYDLRSQWVAKMNAVSAVIHLEEPSHPIKGEKSV